MGNINSINISKLLFSGGCNYQPVHLLVAFLFLPLILQKMYLVKICFSFVQLFVTARWILADFGTYIIGGDEVDVAKHPYLVSLRYRHEAQEPYRHKCAGVIYSERIVITAAQCLVDLGHGDNIIVLAASNYRTGFDGILYPALKWFFHADYSSPSVDYDIGFIIIRSSFEFQKNQLSPVSIMSYRPGSGKIASVAGWGYREEFGPSSRYLKEVEVPIVSTTECTQSYGEGEITERMICAGLVNGGKDACQGDTGGPLIINNQLVGLVSWGRGCGRPGFPTVYAFVASLKDWLDDAIASVTEDVNKKLSIEVNSAFRNLREVLPLAEVNPQPITVTGEPSANSSEANSKVAIVTLFIGNGVDRNIKAISLAIVCKSKFS
uniref:Peptidase S1 domain-containing protein n=1 Tax=Glossina palpalis gambiensis TaxID=67801 RepID=A0A1B0ALE7_9MUSC